MSDYQTLLRHQTSLVQLVEQVCGNSAMQLQLPVREINNPQVCSVQLLPWLAWSRSVHVWRDQWSESAKRNIIADAPLLHRRKGTHWSIIKILSAVDVVAELSKDRTAAPHAFSVTIALAKNQRVIAESSAGVFAEIAELISGVASLRDTASIALADTVSGTASAATLIGIGVASAEPHDALLGRQTPSVQFFFVLLPPRGDIWRLIKS